MFKKCRLLLVITLAFLGAVFVAPKAEAADAFSIIYMDAMDNGRTSDEAYWIAQAIYYGCGQYGVDPLLAAAVMRAESAFNFGAYSNAGAIGLMQLMPGTAEMIGVNPYDPLQNIVGGICHLRTLLDRFAGAGVYAVSYAVAAYNAGSQAIYDNGGFPPYPETNSYVINVAEYYSYYLSMYTPPELDFVGGNQTEEVTYEG